MSLTVQEAGKYSEAQNLIKRLESAQLEGGQLDNLSTELRHLIESCGVPALETVKSEPPHVLHWLLTCTSANAFSCASEYLDGTFCPPGWEDISEYDSFHLICFSQLHLHGNQINKAAEGNVTLPHIGTTLLYTLPPVSCTTVHAWRSGFSGPLQKRRDMCLTAKFSDYVRTDILHCFCRELAWESIHCNRTIFCKCRGLGWNVCSGPVWQYWRGVTSE